MANGATSVGIGLVWVGLLLAGCAPEARDQAKLDFHRDVAPIFKARCLHCHGPHQAQGGLRLDDRAFALQGGLSGKPLVAASPEDSELLRRVTSHEPAVAMPKEGGRLSDGEIATLRRWVEVGAPWPDKVPPSGRDEFLARYGEDVWERLSVFGREWKILFLLAFAVAVGVAERIRRVPEDSERWSRGIRRQVRRFCPHISTAAFLLVVVGTVFCDVLQFCLRLSSKLADTEQKLIEATAPAERRPATLSGAQPIPLRPRGARGLGGTYYRGNDERNEQLFNGGFYRTATMRLSLVDEHGVAQALGQRITGEQLFVRLEIERAVQATPSLFTDQLMGGVLLTRRTADRKEPFPEDEPTRLETLQPGDRWAANYRLGEFTGQSEGAFNGIIYVNTDATLQGEAVQGTQQYGIVYALRIRDRTLLENSELWLGPILLPGNFQYPTPGRITLSEWLDTQPIPEIVGENTSDPKLLGIPEHLDKGAKRPEP